MAIFHCYVSSPEGTHIEYKEVDAADDPTHIPGLRDHVVKVDAFAWQDRNGQRLTPEKKLVKNWMHLGNSLHFMERK